MSRLLSVLSCCLIGISLSMLNFNKKEIDIENKECEENPEEVAVTEITLNSALPFSNVLVNYTNIGLSTQAGAINCLVVSNTDSNLVLAGAQNGGVWISHDAAHSWQPVNDTARTLCVTSIAQNFFRPNEFYYSTGVNITVNNQLLYDIYRSVDFGQTFSIVHPVTPSFGRVSKILTSPIDSNTLYVLNNAPSGTGSLYRTTDNCTTFQLVYQANVVIDDIILLPNGIVEIGYAHSVWRSTTGNSGTFVQSTGLPVTGYDTHLVFCKSLPNIQYCSVHIFPGYDIYKSIDSGQTWTLMSNIAQGRRLGVKPDNPDLVFAGNIWSNVSIDGGVTWQYSYGGHDLRSYNFDPHRSGKIYITSDFGVCTQEVDPV
ncbi:MAG: hypothetical protein ABI772_14395, partial [Bacteroidota bacterium]